MARVASQSSATNERSTAFATSWEHLENELRCLDLRLRRQVLKERRHQQSGDALSQFRGLVITDAEAAELLTPPENRPIGHQNHAADVSEDLGIAASLAKLDAEIQQRIYDSRRMGHCLSLERLKDLFGLTRFETVCLIICLAPELDRKYEKLYAYLQDDATRRQPSRELILRLLCDTPEEALAARAAFRSQAPLLRFRLLEATGSPGEGQLPLLSRGLELDDRITSYILGHEQIDSRLERFARMAPPGARRIEPASEFEQRASRFVQAYFNDPQFRSCNLLLYLHGAAHTGQRSVVESVCQDHSLPLLVADVEAMKVGPFPFEEAAWLLGREAVLQSAALWLDRADCLLADPDKHPVELKCLMDVTRTFARLAFLSGTRPWQPPDLEQDRTFLSIEIPPPDLVSCMRDWGACLAARPPLLNQVDAAVLAGRFRFSAGQIKNALTAAENLARWRSPEDWQVTAADLHAACRAQSSPKLGRLAHKIETKHTWDDLVLPDDGFAQVKELCEQARHRHVVYGEWGFDRKLTLGKGLNALLSGPPGTGKTLAAQVIAGELQLDLYRIDLSQVVSKYIGETEKNLHSIFQEARAGQAILFFDEADALFGKRSEVKDAHDRYANIEVSYLLQKMEEYEGVAILATNLSQHIDDAFLRRIQFVIEFPFPDQQYRRRIWQRIFPHEAPVSPDVDFEVLAREIKLSGGNIKNIAVAAAFHAAGNGGVIRMSHLWRAARREHQKLGRTWNATEPPVGQRS